MNPRRRFIRQLLSIGAGTAASAYVDPFRPRFTLRAQSAGNKTVVVLFQRGGCDGLNACVPYGDSNYYNLRSSIAIAPPSGANANSARDLNGFFGLHPALADFMPIWQAGDLAVLPAVHYPNATQSHFDGQQFIESAASDPNIDGWLNRHLVSVPRTATMRGVGFGYELPQALRGQQIVSSFNDIAEFTTGLPQAEEDSLVADLNRVYAQDPDSTKAWRNLVQGSGRVMVNDLTVLSGIDTASYVPANGAVYPSTNVGRQFKQIAQLIKQDVGLETVSLSIGGWDTHDNEGGAVGYMADRMKDMSGCIRAFYTDLGSRMDDVLVMTMSEFGRTSAQNANGGTDHGHATVWFVVGRPVTGGVYGTWPGLASNQLQDGRYLNHSVDYRNVMAEVMVRHMGEPNVGTVIPNWTYAPIGFLP